MLSRKEAIVYIWWFGLIRNAIRCFVVFFRLNKIHYLSFIESHNSWSQKRLLEVIGPTLKQSHLDLIAQDHA